MSNGGSSGFLLSELFEEDVEFELVEVLLLAKLVLGIVLLFEGFCFVREVGLVAAVVFAGVFRSFGTEKFATSSLVGCEGFGDWKIGFTILDIEGCCFSNFSCCLNCLRSNSISFASTGSAIKISTKKGGQRLSQ